MTWDDSKNTASDPENPSADEQLSADEWNDHVADGHFPSDELNFGTDANGDPVMTDPQSGGEVVLRWDRSEGAWVMDSLQTEQAHFDGTPWVDVTNYGAEGDGSTDDTVALQDAHTAAGVNGTVYYPDGTYLRDPQETAQPDGQTVILSNDATVKFNDGSFDTATSGIFQYTGGSVRIIGGTLDGNQANADFQDETNAEVVEIDGCDYIRFQNVTLVDGPEGGDGLDIDNTPGGIIMGNEIDNMGGYGIHISNGSENIAVIGNDVRNCGFGKRDRGGIDRYSGSGEGHVYIGNRCVDNRQNYNIEGPRRNPDDVTFIGNTSIDNGAVVEKDKLFGANKILHGNLSRLHNQIYIPNEGALSEYFDELNEFGGQTLILGSADFTTNRTWLENFSIQGTGGPFYGTNITGNWTFESRVILENITNGDPTTTITFNGQWSEMEGSRFPGTIQINNDRCIVRGCHDVTVEFATGTANGIAALNTQASINDPDNNNTAQINT